MQLILSIKHTTTTPRQHYKTMSLPPVQMNILYKPSTLLQSNKRIQSGVVSSMYNLYYLFTICETCAYEVNYYLKSVTSLTGNAETFCRQQIAG